VRIERYDDGVPCWVDLMAPDADRAAEFYSALFGWEVGPATPEAGGYRVATVGDAFVAGIMPLMGEEAPPAWMSYVKSDDVDAAAAKAASLGAQVIVEPIDVLEAGRMAVIADPVGAVVSVWQPNQHPGAQLVNEPGTWSWSELVTTDVEGAKEFYGALFGWEGETHGEGPGSYTDWKRDGRLVGGLMPKPPTMPAEVPSYWGIYFSVADTDVAVERIQELGGAVIRPPFDVEPGRVAVVSDPGGASFNVITLHESLRG